jgi:hypothetical protein
MAEFVNNNNELENAVLKLINKEYPLTQENIAEELVIDLKNALCDKNFGKNFPITENNHTILKEKGEGINNLYRLKSFIEKFCNASGGETCDLDEIKEVVKELPDEVGDLDTEINKLMGELNLNGGKKKKKMKGGNPELLKNALHIIHKGVLTLKDKTGEALEALDETIGKIFKIADYVINNFDAFEALGCVRLFMSTLIGEKLSKILESILIGATAVGATMVGIQQAPRYVGYVPILLKYLATGGVVITSSTVCFYIGDYLTNTITIGGDKYNNLSEQGQTLINDLAEKVKKSQEGNVESATEKIEEYNTTITDVINQIKDLNQADKDILKTIENTDGEKESSSMAVVTTEEEEEEEEGDAAAATTAADGDGEEEDGDAGQTAAQNKRKYDNGDDNGDDNNNDNKKLRTETGGKKKKKGRTTQKKKKGTKGKKKASKSKKPKTKKNRKTKKKSNKK